MGYKVPDVLLNGNHKLIEEYRMEQKYSERNLNDQICMKIYSAK